MNLDSVIIVKIIIKIFCLLGTLTKESEKELYLIVDNIKADCKNKKYDCIVGLSGGVDSSYVAYYAKEKLGLRPLLYAVDRAGYESCR